MKQFRETSPKIHPSATIFEGALVVGDVSIGPKVNVWYHATIRGDMASISIGEGTNIQDNAVVHVNTGVSTEIGKYVTVGHGAIIHGAKVGDGALIGMGSILLDNAVIGAEAMVGAGCLVPPGKVVPDRTLVVGNPMRIVRELTREEILANRNNADVYLALTKDYHE